MYVNGSTDYYEKEKKRFYNRWYQHVSSRDKNYPENFNARNIFNNVHHYNIEPDYINIISIKYNKKITWKHRIFDILILLGIGGL